MTTTISDVGRVIQQLRLMAELTPSKLSAMSGVSMSHLGRIERGERLPSASVLRKLAKPLSLSEVDLFSYVGYLSPLTPSVAKAHTEYGSGQLDPYVATVLTQEPVEVQRAVITILSFLKSMARGVAESKGGQTNS